MPYLIDGFNLLRSIHAVDEEYESLTDSEMCSMISRFLRRTKADGAIVFDGIGPPDKSGLRGCRNLEIHFSGRKQDADSWIEYRIENNTAPKRLLVVSTDRRIQRAAKKRGAAAVRSDDFWFIMNKELDRPHRPSPEPPVKRQGITPQEADVWMDIFGLEDPDS